MAQADLVDVFTEDPVLTGIVVILLLFVFAVYLFLRRTLTGFKEGLEDARDR